MIDSKNLVIKNIKENVILNDEVLKILNYSHYNPTKEKLLNLIKKYCEEESIYPFACFFEDEISGVIVVKKLQDRIYEIIDIAVKPKYRKRGIASRLINYIIKNFDIKILYAETDDETVEFYRKYGFKIEIIKNKDYMRYKCKLNLALL